MLVRDLGPDVLQAAVRILDPRRLPMSLRQDLTHFDAQPIEFLDERASERALPVT